MTRQTDTARRLRAEAPGPEEVLWKQLRNRRLDGWKFRRQTPIAGFIVDFCCWEARLSIELDGAQHAAQPLADAERRRAIEANGFLEIRFTNDEVRERLQWVLTEIRRALDLARAKAPREAAPRFEP
ncbi:MAG: endonuclease domain-containing protein [Microvirga sp.]|jgi:very-short-patch-repair endonuclease